MEQDRRAIIYTITIQCDGSYIVNSRSRQAVDKKRVDEIAQKLRDCIENNLCASELLKVSSLMGERTVH